MLPKLLEIADDTASKPKPLSQEKGGSWETHNAVVSIPVSFYDKNFASEEAAGIVVGKLRRVIAAPRSSSQMQRLKIGSGCRVEAHVGNFNDNIKMEMATSRKTAPAKKRWRRKRSWFVSKRQWVRGPVFCHSHVIWNSQDLPVKKGHLSKHIVHAVLNPSQLVETLADWEIQFWEIWGEQRCIHVRWLEKLFAYAFETSMFASFCCHILARCLIGMKMIFNICSCRCGTCQ